MAGSGESTGTALTAAGGKEGSAEAAWKGEMRRRTEVKEEWRRGAVKETKIQNRGTGRKCINGRKQGGRKLVELKSIMGLVERRRAIPASSGGAEQREGCRGDAGRLLLAGTDTGEERPCIFRVNKESFQTSAN